MAFNFPLATSNCSGYRNLIICRADTNSLHRNWLHPAECKDFDLAVSYFGDVDGLFKDESDFYEQAKGPKFPALYNLIVNNMEYILQYDAICLSEDDLYCDAKTISEMFRIFHLHQLWLAQPSLTSDSYYSHEITLAKPGLCLRYTNFVEIMSPIFSKQALLQCLPTFNKTQSGWGIELAWTTILGNPKDKIAIIDAVSIHHTRPLGAGTLYKNITADPWLEAASIAKEYHVSLPFQHITYKECALGEGNC